MYEGRIIGPENISSSGEGDWRNENGKSVAPLEINFAGKYYIVTNSCGTGCRYYSMTDLSTGKDIDVLSPFATAEPAPRTKEGYSYLTQGNRMKESLQKT